jgi:hypothetical protein
MIRMRYFAGSFWTPITDARLQQLEAQGLSAAKIADKLGTTRNSVIGRSQRLRGLSRTFPSYIREREEARAKTAEYQREMEAVLSKFASRLPGVSPESKQSLMREKRAQRCRQLGRCLG